MGTSVALSPKKYHSVGAGVGPGLSWGRWRGPEGNPSKPGRDGEGKGGEKVGKWRGAEGKWRGSERDNTGKLGETQGK